MGWVLSVDDVPEARLHPQPSFKKFWKALRKRILMVRKCGECGTLFSPARVCCPRCLSMDLRWKKSKGKGTVYSFSVVYTAFDERLNRVYLKNRLPYVFVLVELEEGVFMASNLVACKPSDARIGMKVEIAFDALKLPVRVPRLSKLRLPPFRPV